MSLVDQLYIGGSWVDSLVRATNVTGTPVDSATPSGSGELIAGVYTLTLSSVSSGTGTVTVTTQSLNNPYNGRVKSGVALDGATERIDIIPGVSLIFNSGAANSDVATINVGSYLGIFDSFGAGAGVPSSGVRHRVKNDGDGTVTSAVAKLLTQAISFKKTGTVFDYIAAFAEDATEKQAGGGSAQVVPYALKVVNVSGSGASKVADLQVDGVTLDTDYVLDITTGDLQDGTALKAITPAYPYRIVDGPLEGLEFAISSLCAENDICNVLIFNSRYVQIAPDVGGSEGTYGTADVDLTESGQATGTITSMQYAYYWVRILVPQGASSESNPYPSSVALQATESGKAGWDD